MNTTQLITLSTIICATITAGMLLGLIAHMLFCLRPLITQLENNQRAALTSLRNS